MTMDTTKTKMVESSPADGDNTGPAPHTVRGATRPLSPMMSKIKSTKKNVKREVTNFFTETSFTALSRIYKANSIFVRLAWTIVVLSMMVWLGVQCFWLLDKYFRYPIDVKLDLKISSELEFPSVTICNMNPILKSKIGDLPFQNLEHLSKQPKDDELLKTTREKYLMAPAQRPCKRTEFNCQNNECVLKKFRCDAISDCRNNHDEMDCENHKCNHGYFKCADHNCRPNSDRCDGIYNCPDRDDEENCDGHVCKDGFFQCLDNTCRENKTVCDGKPDCRLGEDERNCKNFECLQGFSKCPDQTCISSYRRCDGNPDRSDGEDEKDCENFECLQGFSKCPDQTCIYDFRRCDGNPDRSDGEDEKDCENFECLQGFSKCSDQTCIPSYRRCDGQPDCYDGEDEKDCENFECLQDFSKCSDQTCICSYRWCDGQPDCYDGEDEKDCENFECLQGFSKCPDQTCIHSYRRCDGNPDRSDGEDEKDCENYKCDVGKIKWLTRSSRYFTISLCDGPEDCPDGADEKDCYDTATCPVGFFPCPKEGNCLPNIFLNDGFVDCLSGSDEFVEKNGTATCPDGFTPCPKEGNCLPDSFFKDENCDCLSCGADGFVEKNDQQARKLRRTKRHAEDMDWRTNILQERMKMVKSRDLPSKDNPRELYYLQRNSNGFDEEQDFHSTIRKHDGFHQPHEYINRNKENGNNKMKRDTFRQSPLSPEDFNSIEEQGEEHREEPRRVDGSFSKWLALSNISSTALRYYSRHGSDWQAAMAYGYISAKKNKTVLEEAGHRKENFIVSCEFNGYQCSPSFGQPLEWFNHAASCTLFPRNFTFVHNHKYGSCFTFNSDGPALKTRFQNPDYGLRLELFINQRAYVPNLATEAGARVVVHKRGTMPFPENNGISVMPGRSTSMGLHQVRLSRLPHPHGNCDGDKFNMDSYTHFMGTEYSKMSCLKSCHQLIIIENCGCAAPFYMVLPEMKVCDMLLNETESCVDDLFKFDRLERCEDMCPHPCEEINYEVSISSALWPSDNYREFLKDRLSESNSAYFKSRIENDFAKVQIYYQDMVYTHIQQNKAYESMNLISDLGGQLGLWLGLSAITIGELCSFFFILSRSVTSTWLSGAETRPNDVRPHSASMTTTLGEIYDDLYPPAAKYTSPNVEQFPQKLRGLNTETAEL